MIFKSEEKFEQTFTVTPEIYNGFIQLYKDKNPLHTDDLFAKERGFKGRVMQGNILNGFLSYFIGECLPIKNVIIHSQEIQYKNVVYLNDVLKFDTVVSRIYEAINVIIFEFEFKNQEGKTVANGKFRIGILK
jgi:3-hydroxybutyryl-CoA dehydratase